MLTQHNQEFRRYIPDPLSLLGVGSGHETTLPAAATSTELSESSQSLSDSDQNDGPTDGSSGSKFILSKQEATAQPLEDSFQYFIE